MGYPPVYTPTYQGGVVALGLSVGSADSTLDALFNGCYAQLHVGSPGATGNAGVSSDITRVAVSWNSAAGGAKSMSANPTWGAWAGTSPETIKNLSFWSAATAGTFIGSVQLSAPVTISGGQPLVLDTLTISFPTLAS